MPLEWAPDLSAYVSQGGPSAFSGQPAADDEAMAAERVQRLSWRPSVAFLPAFLNASDCESVIALGEPLLERSSLFGASGPAEHRTSSTAWLSREQELSHPVLRNLVRRIHDVMRVPPDHGDALQLARYGVGEQYRFHGDASPGVPRAFTFLLYLKTPAGGGHTVFPYVRANRSAAAKPFRGDLDALQRAPMAKFCSGARGVLRVAPRQGDAILFAPLTPWQAEDPAAWHGACPVTVGQKWVLQRWARPIFDPRYAAALAAVEAGQGSVVERRREEL